MITGFVLGMGFLIINVVLYTAGFVVGATHAETKEKKAK